MSSGSFTPLPQKLESPAVPPTAQGPPPSTNSGGGGGGGNADKKEASGWKQYSHNPRLMHAIVKNKAAYLARNARVTRRELESSKQPTASPAGRT